ncbi:hypothetical protein GOBAR_AA18030 [Gossypium barbadense]|uniref:Eukaryotic translation initiation factor 3 subunit G N-terminal domain-containing protein n=1 Tax=Gossypium barbadense TaxID=3634 RepID=A0A2P5XH05_GOSBA|nr:hypothetical protein GOBAR_AA18030 [Gossypium barbadense]
MRIILDEDDGEDLDFLLPPKQVIGPDENGIKKVIEYKFNDEGNKVKITMTIQPSKTQNNGDRAKLLDKEGTTCPILLQLFGRASLSSAFGPTIDDIDEIGKMVDTRDSKSRAKEHRGLSRLQGIILRMLIESEKGNHSFLKPAFLRPKSQRRESSLPFLAVVYPVVDVSGSSPLMSNLRRSVNDGKVEVMKHSILKAFHLGFQGERKSRIGTSMAVKLLKFTFREVLKYAQRRQEVFN